MKKRKKNNSPIVSIVMGSKSDWPTMKHAVNVLKSLKVKFEKKNSISSPNSKKNV